MTFAANRPETRINRQKFAANKKNIKYLNTFSNIRFKKKTAQRFQEFSKKFFKTHTEALETMLDFFFFNEISPKEILGPNVRTLETSIKKRINSLIAIIKDIEKNQTQPTTSMLQLLFEQTPPKPKQPRLVEVSQNNKLFKADSFATSLEAIELRKEKNTYKKELLETKNEFEAILNKVNIIKSSFGKPKLQLDMTLDEFNSLKEKIKN